MSAGPEKGPALDPDGSPVRELREKPHPQGAGQFPDTHYPISDYQRVAYATVVRTNPDGTPKHMYPIFDVPSAERAVYLLRSAKPPLTLAEQKAVVETAARFLTRGGPDAPAPAREAPGLWERPGRAA